MNPPGEPDFRVRGLKYLGIGNMGFVGKKRYFHTSTFSHIHCEPKIKTRKTIAMKRKSTLIPMAWVLLLVLNGCQENKKGPSMEQTELGSRSAKVLKQDQLEFKDLNANGSLDPYEDWRLSPEERSEDLLGQMTLEEKAGMLLIADMQMVNEKFMLETQGESEPVTTDFKEEDIVLDKNQFTGEPLPHPVMNTVGTTKGITEHKMRHFIWRTTTAPADTMAVWANKVQALAEGDRLGIPVLFASNP